MNIKKCNKCGWELDIRDPCTHCPICSTKFTVGICAKCGQPVEYYRPDRLVCRTCYDTVVRRPDAHARVRKRREDIYEDWLSKVRSVPKEYPTLTEQQWMSAVRHFNKCALCESESIDARGYFIPFNKGGRYCDWNVIPLCERCASQTKINPNYFLSRPQGLLNIINYLEDKLNGAITGNRK